MNNGLNPRGLFGSKSAGAFIVATTIRRGVLVVVFGAVDGADDGAAVHAGNGRGDYLYCEEVIMDTPTEERNFKLYGEAHPNARLTRAQVVEIRKEAKLAGTSRAWLARRYGVSRSCIDRIILGETWREAL